jgi:hypothetical protein
MNENQVGAKHLVMVITNEVFCNRYGYDRQGKKRNFLRHRRNIWAKIFPVLNFWCLSLAVQAMFTDFLGTDGVGHAGGVRCCNARKNGVTFA